MPSRARLTPVHESELCAGSPDGRSLPACPTAEIPFWTLQNYKGRGQMAAWPTPSDSPGYLLALLHSPPIPTPPPSRERGCRAHVFCCPASTSQVLPLLPKPREAPPNPGVGSLPRVGRVMTHPPELGDSEM